ncbi:helix-turn-helix transcriptional regulator [Crocosphaera sp.]|uniref:helix-turn-helix domain-containing protein n=1 Tax=Crocosphaera sp. TaxID=2729996 RepID=UPI00261CA33D|nr:helix-turn-helix transcriptional regulator [Crocosphaera sp.]MDJ0579072.1 helix-turn-helix transcriptional regulator [Crocosphaera sp.]
MSQTLMKVFKRVEVEVPNLGKRIKEARLKDKRSLTKICASIDMTTANWYRIEAEQQDIPVETFQKIQETLGINFGITLDD